MTKNIRIVLADDHTLVRSGIRSLLEKMEGLEVVGEAADGLEALKLVGAHSPLIAIIDVAMPKMNGLETTRRIRKEFPGVKTIILSMYANEEYVLQAIETGASGYLLKDVATAELEIAIRAVARGETYLSSAVSKHVIDSYRRRVSREEIGAPHLTDRQRQVLQLIAEGHSTKEIARILSIGIKTVETHRGELMKRLDVHDVTGLVRYAIRIGIIAPQ
jgi:DNA-binding NarL/FixJ family response regulator